MHCLIILLVKLYPKDDILLNVMFAVSGPSGYIPVENTNRILYTPFNSKDTLTVGNFTGTGTVSINNK